MNSIEELRKIVKKNNLVTDKESMIDYSHDEFPDSGISQIPLAVVKPESTLQVSKILKWANKAKIPITPRGGGTGLCGGCIPSVNGIVLSLEHLNRIVEIDLDNQMAVVESGVRLLDLYEAVEKNGLFFPPHPGDESAMIGGAIATNAGGSRALKYGVIRNFVKGLEVVLPDGKIVQLGGKLLKNSTGYSLLNLMIGSEGTLGIITKAIINLLPPPHSILTLITSFTNLEKGIRFVPKLLKMGILPMAIEFMETDTIKVAEKFLNRRWPCQKGEAHLLIMIDGNSENELLKIAENIGNHCLAFGSQEIYVAETKSRQKELLEFRSNIYETIKKYVIEILDIVIPPSEIPQHLKRVHELSNQYNLWLPTFGHAGDGNVHTLPLKAHFKSNKWQKIPDSEWKKKYPKIRKALHSDAQKRGGLVSAEHGIGLLKKEYLADAVGNVSLQKMKLIKKIFDPNGILNPGKIF